MIKNFLLCLALLILSSCMPVDDFGAYWDKGVIDPALPGQWESVIAPGDEENTVQLMEITDKGGVYQIDNFEDKKTQGKDYIPMTAKTLNVDGYVFIMAKHSDKKSGGDIVRYKIEDGVLQGYALVEERVRVLLREKYPQIENIREDDCATSKSFCFNSVYIRTFDDAVYNVLAAIPDTEEFWSPMEKSRFRKREHQ